jgi:8-oxo-dGTP diphosphatase
MDQPTKQIDVALAVAFRGATVLVCQRKAGGTFAHYWEFPGGKRENGESLHDCLIREMREELDVSIKIHAPLTPIAHVYPHGRLTLYPFVCEIQSPTLKLVACADARWVSAGELMQYTFPPANESLLKEVAEALYERSSL